MMVTRTEFMDKHLLLDSTPGNTAFMTYNGHAFDLFNPNTWVFDIDDISKALSNICRFGGHSNFYSVAEHSVRVANWMAEQGYCAADQLIGLMHDAIEAYIGDIVRPIKSKAHLGGELVTDLEKSMEYAMFAAFDLLDDDFDVRWQRAKVADLAIFYKERDERPVIGRGLSPIAARKVFMTTFDKLSIAASA